jgi:hypothetical protein
MSSFVLNGAFLKDENGKDFLLVVDIHHEIRSVRDAAMFFLKVATTFEFPVVLVWIENNSRSMAGPDPWIRIARQRDMTRLRRYQIPVSDSDGGKFRRDKKTQRS